MSNRRGKRRLSAVGPNAGTRMRFGPDDEVEFRRTAETLVDEFERWSDARGVPTDRSDADLLLDWRYQYEDGVLDVWTTAHLAEFLLGWCPRKLSASADLCADMPGNVAAFVEFLAQSGRLDPASDRPSTIRSWCERNQAGFVREMADPDNFGMAKSLFAGVGGLDAGPDLDAAGLAELTDRVNNLDPETVGAVLDRVQRQRRMPTAVDPVRLPDPQKRLEAVRATPSLQRVRGLAEYCAAPGVALTDTGNLRLADARALVVSLDTGDEVAGLRSAADLPGLERVVEHALGAGAVRRHQGKLVAVSRFAKLDDLAAHGRLVEAALTSTPPDGGGLLRQVHATLAEGRVMLLAALLHAGPDGLDDEDVLDMLAGFMIDHMPGSRDLLGHLLPTWTERILDDLEDLGLIRILPDDEPCAACEDDHWAVFLSPAGVGPSVDLVRSIDIEVPIRPDLVGASAAELASLANVGHPEDWLEDVKHWLDAASDRGAARDLLVAVADSGQGPLPMMGAIRAIEESVPAHAVEAVRALLGGPAEGTALTWLLAQRALDPAEVSPQQMQSAMLDVLVLSLDVGGEEELVATFGVESAPERAEMLDEIWRVDHPRLGEILDVLGARLPDKAIAKRARRAAVKLRTRQGQQAGQALSARRSV